MEGRSHFDALSRSPATPPLPAQAESLSAMLASMNELVEELRRRLAGSLRGGKISLKCRGAPA